MSTAQGYQVAVYDQFNRRKTRTTVKEYASEIYQALPSGELSLNQPFKATPDTTYPHINQAKWASVVDFGANPDDFDSDTRAIQATIDSGAEVIYFPSPKDKNNQTDYLTDDIIVIRGNVRFVLGLNTSMKSYNGMAGKSIFRIEETTGDAVVFDAMEFISFDNAMDHNIFEHNSSKNLVLKSLLFNNATKTLTCLLMLAFRAGDAPTKPILTIPFLLCQLPHRRQSNSARQPSGINAIQHAPATSK
ncbi:MAG: hypothetical protein DCF25_06870 [Leptolyngbya foveolarum]|uniref:Uncharacterized protein n=1 Tax=Leptolyngbya foveolarum TaxID=47253 RepID=A0A2W4WD75_9CYAN|nr:MAG: hypothetical protein DCF25_06870 [Leptolyngbya foveolarum]